jgi:hypothetical protein
MKRLILILHNGPVLGFLFRKVKFTLEQDMKAQSVKSCIALLFL